MKLYSYIVVDDSGATPNPFFGICTLAVCKPAIRRTASVGDWIMATGPARSHTRRKLVYAMRVTEILPLAAYFADGRFARKKPDPKSPDPHRRVGDNLCRPKADGTWEQLPGPRDAESFASDLGGKNALVSDHYFYFGTHAVEIPAAFEKLIHANQGHRCNFPEELVAGFVAWLEKTHRPGVHGEPTDLPSA